MNKITHLLIKITLICLVIIVSNQKADAQCRIHKKMIGKWQICNPDSTIATDLEFQNGYSRCKIITQKSFFVAQISQTSNDIDWSLGGNYSLKKGLYSEKVKYSSFNIEAVVNTFTIKIKKDYMFIKGVNNDYYEIWKKVNN